MDIDNFAHDEGPSIFYNDDFRAVVEAHVEYLRTHEDTKMLFLEPHVVDRYEFDLQGLLWHYKMPSYMHWIILRVNNLYSLTTFPKELSQVSVPSESAINHLRQIYQTVHQTD